MKEKKKISAEEFDRRFDAGEDISEYLDFDKAVSAYHLQAHHETDLLFKLPPNILHMLHLKAEQKGISSTLLAQQWITEKLQ